MDCTFKDDDVGDEMPLTRVFQTTVSKAHGKHIYRDCKKRRWGDVFPHHDAHLDTDAEGAPK